MKKGLCLLIAVLLLLMSFAVPAFAVTVDGPDHISGNTYFDTRENKFVYYTDTTGSLAVRASVADGMVTTDPVSVKADPGVTIEVFFNGKRLENVSSGTFQDPGEYVVMYLGGTVSQRMCAFTIVEKVSNKVSGYTIPVGFEVLSVTLNGEPLPYEKNYIKMTEEGEYDLRYRCIKTDATYQLTFQADYTGPELTLEEVEDGFARGPVDISQAKEAAVVNIYRDGQKIAQKDVLTESGEYVVELIDEAGNKTTRSFTIMVYFDGSSWLFFVIVLLAAVSVVVYLVHSRKNLRVR